MAVGSVGRWGRWVGHFSISRGVRMGGHLPQDASTATRGGEIPPRDASTAPDKIGGVLCHRMRPQPRGGGELGGAASTAVGRSVGRPWYPRIKSVSGVFNSLLIRFFSGFFYSPPGIIFLAAYFVRFQNHFCSVLFYSLPKISFLASCRGAVRKTPFTRKVENRPSPALPPPRPALQ